MWGSAHLEQVDDEDQGLVRADHRRRAPAAVGQGRRDGELTATAHLHAGHALVPSGDDLALAQLEGEGLATVPRRVELLAGLVRHTDVVHGHALAGDGFSAVADGEVVGLELGTDRSIGDLDVGLLWHYFTSMRSMTKIRVSSGAILEPDPWAP